jgi:hypothetical protein
MLWQSHPPWLDHSNYTWRRVQVMKLLIMQLSSSLLLSSLLGRNKDLPKPHPKLLTLKASAARFVETFDEAQFVKPKRTCSYQKLHVAHLAADAVERVSRHTTGTHSVSSYRRCWLFVVTYYYYFNCKWVFTQWQWFYNRTQHTK